MYSAVSQKHECRALVYSKVFPSHVVHMATLISDSMDLHSRHQPKLRDHGPWTVDTWSVHRIVCLLRWYQNILFGDRDNVCE